MEDYIAKKLAEAKVKNLQKDKDVERKLKEKQEADRKLKEKQEADRKLKEKQETINKNSEQFKVVKTMEQHQKELEEKIKRKVNINKKKDQELEIQKMKEDNQKQAEQKIKDYQDQEQKLKDMREGKHMKQEKEEKEEPIIEQPKIERKTIEQQAEENKQKALAKLGMTEEDATPNTVFNNNVNSSNNITNNNIPKLVFIVPYRDRRQQRNFFVNQMKVVLEDIPKNDYKIYYIHQKDERSFNRGAMRNIGFLVLKELYPNNYKDITVVFNDVDTMPYKKNFLNYFTTNGIVKHFYGFKYALGGIVSIKAGDFEKTKGYPNFWAWGFEDNCLQARVSNAGLTIDRSQFYPLADRNIIQIKDDIVKSVSRSEYDAFKSDNGTSGFHSIQNLKYTINDEMIDVTNFDADTIDNKETQAIYDTSTKKHPFQKKRRGGRMAF